MKILCIRKTIKIIIFQARSLEEKRHWTLELKRVILENYSVDIPSHARQLVMELGQTQHSGSYRNLVLKGSNKTTN